MRTVTQPPVHAPDAMARRYAHTRDPAARDALVRLCEPLVRGIVSDFTNPALGDDLVQVGYLGLLNAIDHFDPSRGTPFLAFARHFVRGEIGHYLRDHHTTVRRPRWMERVNGQIEAAVEQHLDERGRYPGLAALAESLNLDLDTVSEILKTRQAVRTLSLDAEDDEGQPTVDLARSQRHQVQELAFPAEDRLVLIEALERLSPLQRTVVFYIYFTDLTQSDTAQRMGVSQKHVSRVLAGALLRLRQLLSPSYPPESSS